MSTCLFIGGIADGTRRKVKGAPEMVVVNCPIGAWSGDSSERRPEVTKDHAYRRTLFRDTDGKEQSVYLLDELGSKAISLLIERYPEAGKLTVDKADIETVLCRHGDMSPAGQLAFGLALKRLSQVFDKHNFRGCRVST